MLKDIAKKAAIAGVVGVGFAVGESMVSGARAPEAKADRGGGARWGAWWNWTKTGWWPSWQWWRPSWWRVWSRTASP